MGARRPLFVEILKIKFLYSGFPKVVARKTQLLLAVQLVLAAQTQLLLETWRFLTISEQLLLETHYTQDQPFVWAASLPTHDMGIYIL